MIKGATVDTGLFGEFRGCRLWRLVSLMFGDPGLSSDSSVMQVTLTELGSGYPSGLVVIDTRMSEFE